MDYTHPVDGSKCDMSDMIITMNNKLIIVETKQDVLSEFFKEQLETMNKSMDRMATVAEETKALAVETRTQNMLMKQEIEHRFEVQSMAIENKEQAKDIKKLTAKESFLCFWQNPIGKLATGLVTIGLLYIANKLGIDGKLILG